MLKGRYDCAPEFLDDYRLLISHASTFGAPQSLVLVDTEKFVGGTPTHIYLHVSPHFVISPHNSLLLEQGVHGPSIAESLAPFHPDPSQRIIILRSPPYSPCLVLRVQALLELLGNDVGSDITWGVWMSRAIIASIDLDLRAGVRIWVSGCRLFSLHPVDSGQGAFWMEVHDFSVRGRFNYLNHRVDENLAEVIVPSSPRVRAQVQLGYVLHVRAGHDSIAFMEVSALL